MTYGTSFEKLPLATATPKVTAGFMWASALPQAKAVKIPAMAAIAQSRGEPVNSLWLVVAAVKWMWQHW